MLGFKKTLFLDFFINIFITLYRILRWLILTVLLSCTTKTCVGVPELGSKDGPLVFYVPLTELGSLNARDREDSFRIISNCIEEKVGYRVKFSAIAEARALSAAVGRFEAQMGLMDSFNYVNLQKTYDLVAGRLLLPMDRQFPRSVIIGLEKTWKEELGQMDLTLNPYNLEKKGALSPLNTGTIGFLKPNSDVGFLVPRHLLYRLDVFPKEAIFGETHDILYQALKRKLVLAAAMEESWLKNKWKYKENLEIGDTFDGISILKFSKPLPSKIIIHSQKLPKHISQKVYGGLTLCQTSQSTAFQTIFPSSELIIPNSESFLFLQELSFFKNKLPWVLTKRKKDSEK